MKPFVPKNDKLAQFEITRYEQKCVFNEGEAAKEYTGRQILYIFLKKKDFSDDSSPAIRTRQIQELTWPGDEQMDTFYPYWIQMTRDETHLLDKSALKNTLYGLLNQSTEMKHDISSIISYRILGPE